MAILRETHCHIEWIAERDQPGTSKLTSPTRGSSSDRSAASRMARLAIPCERPWTLDSLLDPAVRFEAVATRVVRLSTSCMSTPTCAFDQMTYEDLVGSCLLTLLPGHVGTGLLEM